jgi:hypothetical protein
MANFLGQSRLKVILSEIEPRARFFISLLIFILTCSFCYFFIQKPISSKFKEQTFLLKDLNNQKEVLEKTNFQIRRLKVGIKDLEYKNLCYLNNNYIKSLSIDSVLQNIKKYSLKCLDFKNAAKLKKSDCKKYYYDLKLKGSFSDIISFLNDTKLSNANLKFKLSNIDNQKNGEVIFSTKIRLVKFLKDEIKV